MRAQVAAFNPAVTRPSGSAQADLGEGPDLSPLIQNFDVLADAQGGVKRLRELAIELAVRGLLLDGADRDSWTEIRLSDVVADFQNGISKRRGDTGKPVPVLRLADIEAGARLRQEDLREIALTGDEQDKYSVSFNDILVIRVNGSADLVGRFIPCEVKRTWAYSDHLIRLRLRHDLVDTKFLCAVSRSAAARAHLVAKTVTTAGQRTINQQGLGSLPLLLPPLAEQKRIVAKVDQLMALCDELEARQTKKRETGTRLTKSALDALTTAEPPEDFNLAWKRVSENFDLLLSTAASIAELRSAIVELAMRGQLTAPLSEDGEVPDNDVLSASTTSGKGHVGQVVGDEEQPFPIPGRWRWVRWGHLTTQTSSGWSPQCDSRQRIGDEWGVMKVSAVSWFSFKPDENKALPSGVPPRPEFAVRNGDFLMSRANTAELVGRSVVVDEAPARLLLSDKIVKCSFSEHADKHFMNLFNRTMAARNHYLKHASGTSDSMKNISRDVILSMPVPLPPLAEQRRIVAKVEQLLRLCDVLEARLQASEELAARLADALVSSATTSKAA